MTTRINKTMQRPKRLATTDHRPKRAGTILPGLIVGMVCSICCLALVLDKLWLDAAETELRTTSEAAAFAAARELVHDDLLCEDHEMEESIEAARQRAKKVAWQNCVAGEPVQLNASPDGDIQFGQLVLDSNTEQRRFLRSTTDPKTVVVTSRRQRSRGNPVALFFRKTTGVGNGEAVSQAEVTASNQVLGVRPFDGVPVPALPLAIMKSDLSGKRSDTWDHQITARNGADRFRFNAETGEVEEGQDGIPEISLHGMADEESATDANLQLVDLNTDLRTGPLLAQFEDGWTRKSLKEFGGELMFHPESQWMTSSAALDWDHTSGLEQLIGKPRICLLYSDLKPAGDEGYGKLRAVDFVAGRIMEIQHHEENRHVLVFQPTVITTRTAVLANTLMEVDRLSAGEQKLLENPYLYKLQLTR